MDRTGLTTAGAVKGFRLGAGIAGVLGSETGPLDIGIGTIGGAIGAVIGEWATGGNIVMATFPPGYWAGDKGAEEWGRRQGCGAEEGKRLFHKGIKQGDNMADSTDAYGVNPETGDVIYTEGNSVGKLGDVGAGKSSR